jgi:uncharacterized protein
VLIYLHGFNSSPASFKANLLKQAMAERGRAGLFHCPALDHRPVRAMSSLEALLANADTSATLLVGSSLGGFYATFLVEKYGCTAALLNPAITPHVGLRAYLGRQKNLYTGEEYELTEAHLAQLAALHVPRVAVPERYLLLTETGDELIDYREGVMKYIGASQIVVEGGDHALSDFSKYVDQVLAFAGY